jgi:hypothetical protein
MTLTSKMSVLRLILAAAFSLAVVTLIPGCGDPGGDLFTEFKATQDALKKEKDPEKIKALIEKQKEINKKAEALPDAAKKVYAEKIAKEIGFGN